MKAANSESTYGWVAVALHWLVAVAVVGLFALGFYMVELTYYDDWYRRAPHIHRSIGILLFFVMVFRLVWRTFTLYPKPLPDHSRVEVAGAKLGHLALYLLIFVAMFSGYLISTADGSSVEVFDWFQVPSLTGRVRELEEIAGDVHYWATWALIVMAGVHTLAALKHHFIDRDDTLRRMLGRLSDRSHR